MVSSILLPYKQRTITLMFNYDKEKKRYICSECQCSLDPVSRAITLCSECVTLLSSIL